MSVHSSTQETATAEAKTKTTSRGGASRRASTHLASGVIGKAEGAVVVRSKRLSADAFLNLTRLPTVVLVDITLKRLLPLLFSPRTHTHTRTIYNTVLKIVTHSARRRIVSSPTPTLWAASLSRLGARKRYGSSPSLDLSIEKSW